jgi:hypothetical protein
LSQLHDTRFEPPCGLLHKRAHQQGISPPSSVFPLEGALPSSLVTSDQAQVCSLSCGVMLPCRLAHSRCGQAQPLSAPLQGGLRFLRPPLPTAPPTRLAARFPSGRTTGLPRSVPVPAWVRFCLSAGGATSAMGELGAPIPDPLPFGPSVSASWTVQHLALFLTLDAYRGSLTLTIPRHPDRLNRPVPAVTASTHVSTAVLADVAALSPGLRTPPLPAMHAWVGYW